PCSVQNAGVPINVRSQHWPFGLGGRAARRQAQGGLEDARVQQHAWLRAVSSRRTGFLFGRSIAQNYRGVDPTIHTALPESQGMTTMSKFDQTSRLRERHSPDKRDDVPPQTCPVRLVVGFQRILLLVENWPGVGWYVLDSYSLADETDRDLLTGV